MSTGSRVRVRGSWVPVGARGGSCLRRHDCGVSPCLGYGSVSPLSPLALGTSSHPISSFKNNNTKSSQWCYYCLVPEELGTLWCLALCWVFRTSPAPERLGECLCPHQDEKRRDQCLTSGLGKVEAGWAGLKAQAARVGVPLCLDSVWEAGGFSQHLLSLPGLDSLTQDGNGPHPWAVLDSGSRLSPLIFPRPMEVLSSLTPII